MLIGIITVLSFALSVVALAFAKSASNRVEALKHPPKSDRELIDEIKRVRSTPVLLASTGSTYRTGPARKLADLDRATDLRERLRYFDRAISIAHASDPEPLSVSVSVRVIGNPLARKSASVNVDALTMVEYLEAEKAAVVAELHKQGYTV